RRMVRRAVERFRRPSGVGGSPSPAPPVAAGRVELDGVGFALVGRVGGFMAAVPGERRIAVCLGPSRDVQMEYRGRGGGFRSAYAEGSPEYQGFFHAKLFCAGCGWGFPGSFTMSLTGMLDGFGELGRTGRCTRCGSMTSLLAYECFPPAEITDDDAAALRR